jgi:hypothetical protein
MIFVRAGGGGLFRGGGNEPLNWPRREAFDPVRLLDVRDTSDLNSNDSIENGGETSDDGDTSVDEEEQFSDDGSAFD